MLVAKGDLIHFGLIGIEEVDKSVDTCLIWNRRKIPTGCKIGGAGRDRTAGLLNAIQARSQLRHSPQALKVNRVAICCQ